MSWKDSLRAASFRGVQFFVESIESAYGRRQVTHEYPANDTPYTEDLGRKFDEFTVEGYLLGDDYPAQRDRMIAACRDHATAAVLVHPYQGEKSVYCTGLRTRESSDKGGMVVLQLTFREAGIAALPAAVADAQAAVAAKAEAAKEAAKQSFLQKYVTQGLPAYVLASASAAIGRFGDLFTGGLLGPLGGAAGDIADFAKQLDQIRATATDIALRADEAASNLRSAIGQVRGAYANGLEALNSLLEKVTPGERTSTAGMTAGRRQEQDNALAIIGLIRVTAIAEAASTAAAQDFPSYDDAIEQRNRLLDHIDADAETADDDTYLALMALRAELARGVPDATRQLPRIIRYTPMTTAPALVLAQRLYGDASREAEIVARNTPRHPGFMPGGRPLEVLSDAG